MLPSWVIGSSWIAEAGFRLYYTMKNAADSIVELLHCPVGYIAGRFERDLHLIVWLRPSLEWYSEILPQPRQHLIHK